MTAAIHSAVPNALGDPAETGDTIATNSREMDEDESRNEGPMEGETGDTSELVSASLLSTFKRLLITL